MVFEEDSNENFKRIIGKERVNLNKDRLDWIMSGLKKHALTKYEDHFRKSALEDFDKNHALTEQQEEKLEKLYKEKSQLNPARGLDHFSFKESTPQKRPLRRPRRKEQ